MLVILTLTRITVETIGGLFLAIKSVNQGKTGNRLKRGSGGSQVRLGGTYPCSRGPGKKKGSRRNVAEGCRETSDVDERQQLEAVGCATPKKGAQDSERREAAGRIFNPVDLIANQRERESIIHKNQETPQTRESEPTLTKKGGGRATSEDANGLHSIKSFAPPSIPPQPPRLSPCPVPPPHHVHHPSRRPSHGVRPRRPPRHLVQARHAWEVGEEEALRRVSQEEARVSVWASGWRQTRVEASAAAAA